MNYRLTAITFPSYELATEFITDSKRLAHSYYAAENKIAWLREYGVTN